MTAVTIVDAFASRAFSGNPAAVCVLAADAGDAWMQSVARELALPATAFMRADGDRFRLRWFTVGGELELCGHGTLATAHVLWERRLLAADKPARFESRSGALTATRRGEWIELDFPATPPGEAPPSDGLVDALGVAPTWIGRSRFDYIVEVASGDEVANLRPDFERLRRVQTRGVIVTSRSTSAECDFVSRFFAPSLGLNEDAVTGSAHCCLGPYWAARLGKTSLVARQLSARGGELQVRVDADRVRLAGRAVTVLNGELAINAS